LTALILLLYAWSGLHKQLSDGIIAAIAMIVCYGFRFIFEFFKEPFNVIFDGAVTLTMGHLLSLLTVLLGIVFLIYARNVSQKAST
ncbi:MAG: prolipoprotein diacylglyceryl transferase family protein, partial [Bacteroidota bacterium]